MKKFSFSLLLLILTATVHADGSISGWVHNAGGITPIHPVSVHLVDPVTGELVPGLETVNAEEDGSYEIRGIPEGSYKVLWDAHGAIEHYIDELSGNAWCDNGGCDRTVVGNAVNIGSKNVTLNVNLTSGTIIAGEVTDNRGKPVAGVVIETFDQNGEVVCCTRVTDEDGQYSKTVKWPEIYYVRTRDAGAVGYQDEVYKNVPCDDCDPVANGQAISMARKPARFVDFELDSIEVVPDEPPVREAVAVEKLSGSWFDPERDGEGFIVQVLDRPGPGGTGQEIIVFWFTYTPEGGQAWMVGVGHIVDGRAEVEFEITSGAAFGAGFDPLHVVRQPWGSASFDFINCGDATVDYDGTFGSGTMQLERLTSIQGLGCDEQMESTAADNAVHTGAWFNLSRDGEGLIVEVIGENTVLVYWFTYDSDGRQMWMLGVDDLEDDQGLKILMERTSGGKFGDDFDPDSVLLSEWGELILQFTGCDSAVYSWTAPAPYYSGGFDLVRLTAIKKLICSAQQ